MKRLIFAFGLVPGLLGGLQSFGQNGNHDRSLVIQYAKEANRLDLQSNPDSIAQAYTLHCKVLLLDKKYEPSYRSKISIEYKRGNYNDALNSAIAFVTNLPDFGNAWVYLGFVQAKLNDTTGAINSFERAINIYEAQLKETKDKNWKDQLCFQIGIVQNFLGEHEPSFSVSKKIKTGETTSISMSIADAESAERYVDKYMTYNGVQFF